MDDFVYLNYAATSNKKPQSVQNAVQDYLCGNMQFNAGRNLAQIDQSNIIFEARTRLADFFKVKNPKQIIFTSGVTLSLNMILLGLLDRGDHVITTSLEHNAVVRPLNMLERERGVEVSYLACEPNGSFNPDSIRFMIKTNTKMLVMTHASNVLGTILPYQKCFEIAKEYGLVTVLDAAQTAGYCEIAFEDSPIDILAITGHKSLMALAGIGGFIVKADVAPKLRPVICGGTGSSSHSTRQPEHLPDKFEPGTPNLIGIRSLSESIQAIQQLGLQEIRTKEEMLRRRFCDGLDALPVKRYGTKAASDTVPTVSITCGEIDCGILSQQLFERYKIITRSGLHCAPLAHKSIGTFPKGTLRFSFGLYTASDEIDYALSALKALIC